MDKVPIKSRLLESLDLELTYSGLNETDLDFQNYIVSKFGYIQSGLDLTCFECGEKIRDGECVCFVINAEDHKSRHIHLDTQCLFEKYTLPIIIKRSKKYFK